MPCPKCGLAMDSELDAQALVAESDLDPRVELFCSQCVSHVRVDLRDAFIEPFDGSELS